MVLRAPLQFFAHRKETLAVHLSPVPNLNHQDAQRAVLDATDKAVVAYPILPKIP